MAEQTFRSPGFFEQEIDLSARRATPLGTPAGVIGTAVKGPAFVPVTVGSLADFEAKFGALSSDRFGPYAVREFLKHKNSVTFVRVLGAGANETDTHRANSAQGGYVQNAGFKIASTAITENSLVGQHLGCVQFLAASHDLRSDNGSGLEAAGYPVYTDNDSFKERLSSGDDKVNLIRAVLFTPTGSRFEPLDHGQTFASHASARDSLATAGDTDGIGHNYFKLALSSSSGADFANDESNAGVRIFKVSLDPNSGRYISKVLNTDPDRFQEEEHLLWLDYAVEDEIASVSTTAGAVALLSGSASTTTNGYDTTSAYRDLFGRHDTRYSTPRTPLIISQPFGSAEFDLFHFETISDGAWANNKYKVSIANLRKSSDPKDPFGTFDVQVRKFDDTDLNLEIIEYYPECNLDPSHENYVARKIGDKKVSYNFDAADDDERRLVISGKYPNKSSRVRIRMHDNVELGRMPKEALPFGFRGLPVLKTSNTLTDLSTRNLVDGDNSAVGSNSPVRLGGHNISGNSVSSGLTGSIVPPLPLRFKCTRGAISTATSFAVGQVGTNERVDARFYWGVKFERLPMTSSADQGSVANAVLNTNIGGQPNPLVSAYTKFQGISQLDTLVTGSGKDLFNNNKFTLARVALQNQLASGHISDITGTAKDHMLEAAYIRNGTPDASDYTVHDTIRSGRITLATLVHSSSTIFNRFQSFCKFNTVFYGGFDGLNVLDKDNRLMTDRATSQDTGGKAGDAFDGGLGLANTDTGGLSGTGKKNNIVKSFRSAVDILTDPMSSRVNILAIPGMRDSFITDYTMDKVKDYSMAIYLVDMLNYDKNSLRLFDDSTEKVDVRESAEQFESRAIDNNYSATYFPDVYLNDPVNRTNVKVPPSVVALGALAFNDKVAYPWFAPAGFNRGALDAVANVDVRLNAGDRDALYDSRINPIAVFPSGGFVIFGQKTLQMAKSALDRVNVRRLLLEVKRLVSAIATKLLFEQNNSATRDRFVNQVTPLLALVQAQAGIEQFRVVCDDTNNNSEDVESNKMNGRIVIVPTRAVEFIAIDFIITNSGVSFE